MVVVLLFRAGAGTAMPPALRLLKWGVLKVVLVLGLCGWQCVSEAFALRGCLRGAARYPVGYDPARRGRPAEEAVELAADVEAVELLVPAACAYDPRRPPTLTRASDPHIKNSHIENSHAGRWRPPVGYDPRRRGRPALPVAEENEDSKDSAMRRALCLGVWMGQSVVARIKE